MTGPRRLYTRIFFHFVGLLAIVGAVSSFVFATGARSAFLHHWAIKFARHAGTLVGDRFDDAAERDRAVQRLSDELDVEVTVRGADGAVLVAAGPALPAIDMGDERLRVGGGLFAPGGREHWFSAAPITDRTGRIRGVIQLAPMRRMPAPSLWRPAMLVALALLVLGIGTAPLARRISRPVERLTEGTRRLAGGDLSYRVPLGHRGHRGHRRLDQLDELTRAWNDMAERVQNLVRGHKELLANVSHELRSPLARIRVALEMVPRDADGERRLGEIEQDLVELDSLIETLLTASRLEASGLPAELGRVDVRALLERVAERARRDPLVAGREVRVDAPADLIVDADAKLLDRALWNLVENAAKYGAPPITLAARRDGARVELSVSDEGPGIPVEERERVLAPFYRGRATDSATSGRRGFGLGLTLAQRVAQVHGGALRVDGPVGAGRGCRVILTLG